MPHWLIKSGIQHVIAALPFRQRWNELFQEYGTKSLQLDNNRFTHRLNHCREHLENFYSAQASPPGSFTALELGTGWYPVPTIGFYLCGAGDIWSVDIDPLLRRSRMKRMLDLFCEFDDRGDLKKYLPRLIPERMAKLREEAKFAGQESPETFLKRFNIHVMVRDAQKTDLPANTIDFFSSTGVLEYIPRSVLRGIFLEFRRLCTPRAITSHWINLVDQFSYFDKTITPFNFLKYTSAQWRFYNSPLIWQNRLRISDYRKLLSESGYDITKENSASGNAQDLKRLQLAPEFRHYTPENILVITSWLVARPRA